MGTLFSPFKGKERESLPPGSKDGAVFHVNNRAIHLSEGEQIWSLWLNIQEEEEESRAVLEFEKC